MPGDHPAWGSHYPFEHTYGYAEDVYEHGEGPQAEGLNQVQSYFDEDEYNYRRHVYNTGQSNYYWSDYTRQVACAPGDVYGSYAQHQYQNGPRYRRQTYTVWESEYRDNGGEATYFHSDYYDPTSNLQRYPDPNRFPTRERQVVRAVHGPPSPPTPRSPSPSYLSTSLSPSAHTEAPFRKLLILDLNGTLLFRPKPPFQRRPSRAATPRNNPTSASQPVKRIVLARPYLACFREYLFHPSTKEWLDVMIWSSAQPHSVNDMLQQCFPVPKKPQDGDGEASSEQSGSKKLDDRFIAVWARDTLGLSRDDYSRKSQTTKDLQKPWSQLAPRSMAQPDESSDDEHTSLRHSAHTTLLLDDSPLKARLQPWNHVCLREYDAEARDEDVKALLREQDGHAGKMHPEDVIQSSNLSGMLPRRDSAARFDATLLAVIGVLEGVKNESNVAGWIRAGGLWGETDEEKGATIRIVEHENRAAEHISHDPPSVGGMKHGRDADDSEPCPLHPAKRARAMSWQAPALASLAHPTGFPLDGTAGSPSPRPSAIPSPPSHGPATVDPGPRNDRGDVPRAEGNKAKAPTVESQTLWFTHAATFDYWVCQGRKVLLRLEIKEEHGVTVEEEYRVKAVSSIEFPRQS